MIVFVCLFVFFIIAWVIAHKINDGVINKWIGFMLIVFAFVVMIYLAFIGFIYSLSI